MIITITGPTCSGKTTLENALVKLGVGKTISHTTRLMRVSEVDGQDYHFVSDGEYDRLAAAGEFIEQVSFGSTRYAMSAKSMREALGKHAIVAVVAEPVGTEQIVSWAIAQGIPHYALWLGVPPLEQAKRFLSRVMNDAMFGVGNAAATGAVRLAEMLSTEQGWDSKARNGSINGYHGYSHMLFGGTTLSPDELAAQLLATVKKG